MRLLLDTNVISDFVRGEPLVQQALLACAPKEVAVSSVTVMEIAYGLARNPARARRIAPVIEELLESITTLPYDPADAHETGHIRAALESGGQPIGLCDAMIAGTARQRNLTLVTHNAREFSRVADLRCVDWREPSGRTR
jgi:tRNA(fMet)-specific endonuclease VapC